MIKPPKTWNNVETHFKQAIEHPWYKLISDLYGQVYYSTNSFYQKKKFTPGFVPVTTQAISSPMGKGSDSLPVQISLFESKTYLADSMQFHLEYLLRQGFEGVFYIMPSFRGENPGERHLNQFFHSEAEMKGDLDDVMNLVEEYIAELSETILSGADTDSTLTHLKSFQKNVGKIRKVNFEEARSLLQGNPECFSQISDDLSTISSFGEKKLLEHFDGAVWLINPPVDLVPFYQAKTDDNKHARAADLLLGIGETVGCGERHFDGKAVLESISEHEVSPDDYTWYIQMKDLYPIQTAGFGMGLERFLLWVLNHNDIRDMQVITRFKDFPSIP